MSSSHTPTRRVAVITGAAMGIGAGIARRLVADGCAVVVNDLPAHEGALSALVAELGGSAKAQAYAADVSVEDGVRRLIAAAVEAFGGIDIVGTPVYACMACLERKYRWLPMQERPS
jgi:NAD(P)-dependent dehydrogenase (short-subunit alcohol dehydrogenase family)